ncbi:MAG: hypothetical protein ACRD4X_18660 [Candidatus Acidiferrales bacterium]
MSQANQKPYQKLNVYAGFRGVVFRAYVVGGMDFAGVAARRGYSIERMELTDAQNSGSMNTLTWPIQAS